MKLQITLLLQIQTKVLNTHQNQYTTVTIVSKVVNLNRVFSHNSEVVNLHCWLHLATLISDFSHNISSYLWAVRRTVFLDFTTHLLAIKSNVINFKRS